MIWDIHHHWVNEKGYIDRLLQEMDRLEIERLGLIAMGEICRDLFVVHEPTGRAVADADLAELIKKYPDRFWGYGYVRPGENKPEYIDKLADMGMKGLKFHMPLNPYDSEEYFDLYAKAAEYNLPCLFHTGIFYLPGLPAKDVVSSENFRPIRLETIAYAFPKLPLIAAHLGVCWTEEAATLCRIVPNIYADLSGRVGGWLSGKSIEWFKQTFYWPEAHKKILFGSDVHAEEVSQTLEQQKQIFIDIGWSEQQLDDVFCNNAKRLFSE